MMQSMFLLLLNSFIFICTAFLAYTSGIFFIKLSHSFNLLDYPAERKLHPNPIPFLGGVSIFFSFWLVVFLGLVAADILVKGGWNFYPLAMQIFQGVVFLSPQILIIFLGALVILIVGFFDDKFHWSPLKKIGGQILAVLVLMSLNLRINLVGSWGFFGYLI